MSHTYRLGDTPLRLNTYSAGSGQIGAKLITYGSEEVFQALSSYGSDGNVQDKINEVVRDLIGQLGRAKHDLETALLNLNLEYLKNPPAE
jgi:hypothetical protein